MATTAGFTPSRHVSLCSSTRCIFFFFLETSTCVVPCCRPPVTTGRVRLTRKKIDSQVIGESLWCVEGASAAKTLVTSLSPAGPKTHVIE